MAYEPGMVMVPCGIAVPSASNRKREIGPYPALPAKSSPLGLKSRHVTPLSELPVIVQFGIKSKFSLKVNLEILPGLD